MRTGPGRSNPGGGRGADGPGADPNAELDDGKSPIYIAVTGGRASHSGEAVAALLDAGANPVASDNEADLTPLGLIEATEQRPVGNQDAWAEAGLGAALFSTLRLHNYRKRWSGRPPFHNREELRRTQGCGGGMVTA